jgi:hypothetical protein
MLFRSKAGSSYRASREVQRSLRRNGQVRGMEATWQWQEQRNVWEGDSANSGLNVYAFLFLFALHCPKNTVLT